MKGETESRIEFDVDCSSVYHIGNRSEQAAGFYCYAHFGSDSQERPYDE